MHLVRTVSAALGIALFSFISAIAADDAQTDDILLETADSSATGEESTKSPSTELLPAAAAIPDSSMIRRQSPGNERIVRVDGFHRLEGVYGLIAGAFTIVAGVILLDKAEGVPFAIACMSVGGISIGFGIWEITIGSVHLQSESNCK